MKRFFAIFLCLIMITSCGISKEDLQKINYDIHYNKETIAKGGFSALNQIYVNANEIFTRFGYDATESKKIYTFNFDNDSIIIDLDKSYILRNDLKIMSNNRTVTENNVLYIEKTLAEELLPVKVTLNQNKIAVHNYYDDAYGFTNHQIIAHAFGAINGRPETCSLEAFTYNYQNGCRLFEVDLILTSDDKLIARHDWSEWLYTKFLQEAPLESKTDSPISLAQIKAMPIFNEYTAIDFYDIAVLMSQFKDMYLVTDTKEYEENLVKKQFEIIVNTCKDIDPEILNRIVPQFYTTEMYDVVKEIYDFRSYIFTLYMTDMVSKDVVSFAKANDIKAITMPYGRVDSTYTKMLKDENIVCYVHTLNNMETIQGFIDIGVHGFYSDYITPYYFYLQKNE